MKIISKNKKAYFDYEIVEETTCWIVLLWHEVKSVRASNVNMKWAYANIRDWAIYIKWLSISRYNKSSKEGEYDPERKRELLINKKELAKLESKIKEKWFTLIPTSIWINNNKIKVNIWLWRWKKKYEKKDVIKRRDIDRDIKRDIWRL